MPENAIPLEEGQKSSADDVPGATRLSLNWMVDSNDTTILRPGIVNTQLAPGKYTATTGINTGILGVYVWKSVLDGMYYAVYVRQDRMIFALNLLTNQTLALSSASDATTLLQGTTPAVTFTEDTQRLIIAGGGQLQQWTGLNLSSRLGPYVLGVTQPPLAATHVVSLAGYLIANQTLAQTNNQILWSNLGDGNHPSWFPLNFNTADADPDSIVALAVNLRELAAFGTKTLQIFGVGTDPTLPFVASASLAIGCAAPYSPVVFDGRYAWLDDARRFVVSDGRAFDSIGDDVSKLIRDMSTVSDCFGFRLKQAYWDLLVWIFPTAQRGYAYDLRRKEWFQWRGWNGTDDYAAVRIGSYAFHQSGNLHIVSDPLFENLWTLDATSFSDTGPGLPIVAERVTQRLDWGTGSRKCCRKVRFFVRRGTAPITNSDTAYLEVSKRDDDRNWSPWKRLGLGFAGDGASFVDWFPGGVYRRRQYRVRYSGGLSLAITRAIETWEAYAD